MEKVHEQHETIAVLKAVEEWWLTEGKYQFLGAPNCIFLVRELLADIAAETSAAKAKSQL